MRYTRLAVMAAALAVLSGCATTKNGEWAPTRDQCAAAGALLGIASGVAVGGEIIGAAVGAGAGAVIGEVLCIDPDSDGDGVADGMDRCPATPQDVRVDASGCPLDSDADGVADYLDKCPATPAGAAVDLNGCALDSDADGVPDYADLCPGTPAGARVDEHGCEPQPVINHVVYFDFDRDAIRASERAALDDVAAMLAQHPAFRVQIAGHADALGSPAYNRDLSARRAEAVIAYLVNHGIDRARLRVEANGEAQPAASNATDGGRARNRRVEFKVLDR